MPTATDILRLRFLYPFTYACIFTRAHTHANACHDKVGDGGVSENNLQESAVSFHQVSSGSQALVARLGDNYLYLLNHLSGPENFYFNQHY